MGITLEQLTNSITKIMTKIKDNFDNNVGDLSKLKTENKDSLVDALNENFTSVINGKQLLETTINDMGGTVSKNSNIATFLELKEGILKTFDIISNCNDDLNLFVQLEEPENKNGLWFKTDKKYECITDKIGPEHDITSIDNTQSIDVNVFSSTYNDCVCVEDNIYIVGCGKNGDQLIKYNIKNKTYETLIQTSNLQHSRIVEYNNCIYIVGGGSSNTAPSTKYLYKYNILTNTVTKLQENSRYFYDGSVCCNGDYIYIQGGIGNGIAAATNAYKYCINTDTYTTLLLIPYKFYNGCSVYFDGYIYMLGTSDSNARKNLYKYNIEENTYTFVTNIPYNFYNGNAKIINNNIYLIGGQDSKRYFYSFNILSSGFTQLVDLPYDFYSGCSCVYAGSIFLLGGVQNTLKNYMINIVSLPPNAILFLNKEKPFKYKVKMFNTKYGVLNNINFDSVIMTDNNGENCYIPIYIGDGNKWSLI